jgi:hypothetical protein
LRKAGISDETIETVLSAVNQPPASGSTSTAPADLGNTSGDIIGQGEVTLPAQRGTWSDFFTGIF